MPLAEKSILLSFFRLIFSIFVGKENLILYDTLDWEKEISLFSSCNFKYPEYYLGQDFHGIKGGYLNAIAPVTYDAVTRLAAPPNETKLRQSAIAKVTIKPQRFLDLGCGTGSSTILLKQAFPQAEVTGLDLSPYMLTMAQYKAKKANLTINWQQGLAESTNFTDCEFDLISVAFLFHETPVQISQAILQECLRLLKPGGQIIILDGAQKKLRHTNWLIKLFREPYSQVYAEGNVDCWLQNIGFKKIKTQNIGWISQLTVAFKAKDNS
ncbi:MAG: class I SAM-dependent methyltransferase [Pleurocapsa sp.]